MRRLFEHRRELSERELAAVRDGVRAGVAEALRDIDFGGAVAAGVRSAFDIMWPADVGAAIREGIKEAVEDSDRRHTEPPRTRAGHCRSS